MYDIACHVDAGSSGRRNDDRSLVNRTIVEEGGFSQQCDNGCLVVICDGVGGELFGNEAAQIAVETFMTMVDNEISISDVEQWTKAANDRIVLAQGRDIDHANMSTTLAGLWIKNEDFILFNVGDTRIYRFRDPYLSQMSTDHTLSQDLKNMGLLNNQDCQHVITKYLGGSNYKPEITFGENKIFEKDMFLLCSDGLHDALDDLTLEKILTQDKPLQALCSELIQCAKESGSLDNISVILVRRN